MLAHYSYFGAEDTKRPYGYAQMGAPCWEHPLLNKPGRDYWVELNPILSNYIEETLFPNGPTGETHIGVRLTLDTIVNTQLTEAIAHWCRLNKCAVIFVDRNPFDCYVSLVNAQRFNRWTGHTKRPLLPITIDPEECTAFVHNSLANRDKTLRVIQQATQDYCLIQYRWLYRQAELEQILADYLRLPVDGFGAIPLVHLNPYHITQRVENFSLLRKKVSSTVRDMMDVSEKEDNFYHVKTRRR